MNWVALVGAYCHSWALKSRVTNQLGPDSCKTNGLVGLMAAHIKHTRRQVCPRVFYFASCCELSHADDSRGGRPQLASGPQGRGEAVCTSRYEFNIYVYDLWVIGMLLRSGRSM